MTPHVSMPTLEQVSILVEAQLGLYFPRDRWGDLARKLAKAAPDFGFSDAEACCRWLLATPLSKKQINMLACHLTIGETYFFRGREVLSAFQDAVLRRLIQERQNSSRTLRIWSAGCSSGEEAYTIAMILTQTIPDIKRWNITILATDINTDSLHKAIAGRYRSWSFRETMPPEARAKYFREVGDCYEVLPHIRQMVTFSHLNLVEDCYPSLATNTTAMDIIFSQNVIMYFADERRRKVVENLYHCLTDEGWVIVSPSEVPHLIIPQLKMVNLGAAIFYHKEPVSPATAAIMPPPKAPLMPPVETLQRTASYTPPAALLPDSFASRALGNGAHYTPPGKSVLAEARQFYNIGEYGRAAEILLKFLSDNGANDEAHFALLIHAKANLGHLDEALTWCHKALANHKLNPHFYYLQATIYQEKGDLNAAAVALKRVLYLDPDYTLAYFILGNMARHEGKTTESRRHFQNARASLKKFDADVVLSESDGMTAGRLLEIIDAITS